jgi:hypothetical protein
MIVPSQGISEFYPKLARCAKSFAAMPRTAGKQFGI